MENNVFIGKKTVAQMVALSDSTIYRLERRGDFPKRVQLSPNRVAWVKQDVIDWIKDRQNA
ncbi:helix-turn-helix transcriptional regulator [Oligella urethralis]|uniref:helix-turn-helix transcriptional regulator n=1 Tax=Oligella urethralis TaxID=90245 RepID=UPI00243076B1|nr:AlpA family phage regulatory protein [Oligella urethralis]